MTPVEAQRAKRRAARQTNLPVGAIVWAIPGEGFSSITKYEDELLVGSGKHVLVLDHDEGIVVDAFSARNSSWMDVAGTTLLMGSTSYVSAVDLTDRAIVWSHPGLVFALNDERVMVHEGGQLVADPTTVTCIEMRTGQVRWQLHGRGSRPGLIPLGFARNLAWLAQRIEYDYVCIGVNDDGMVVTSSAIGGTATSGHILGNALVAGYRWAWLSDLVSDVPCEAAWRYSPYPVARDGGRVLWFEDRYMKGTRYWFGDEWKPVDLIPESDEVHAEWPDGGGSVWKASAGYCIAVGHRGALHMLRPQKAALTRALTASVRGGSTVDHERLWLLCQPEFGEPWLVCLDSGALGNWPA